MNAEVLTAIEPAKNWDRFDQLEAEIAKLPKVDAPIKNHFSHGIYAREMKMAKGTILTGKIHKHDCFNAVFGDITVFNETEGFSKRLTGFNFFSSPAGTRRAGIAHEDTTWITFHPNPDEERDMDAIEDSVIEKYTNPLLTSGDHKIES